MSEPPVPLFPLNTVLFPGGPLPLRIFEARYLDMVKACLRSDTGFGVGLIVEGQEAGGAAVTAGIGTYARITDWNQLDDGLLGITAVGEFRIRILDRRVRPDQLVECRIERLADEPTCAMPEEHRVTADVVRAFLDRLDALYRNLPSRYDDATWVGYRLAELLPLPLSRKQYLLELEDPLLRLGHLHEVLETMAEAPRG